MNLGSKERSLSFSFLAKIQISNTTFRKKKRYKAIVE